MFIVSSLFLFYFSLNFIQNELLHQFQREQQQQLLTNSNVQFDDNDDESLAHFVDKRYANKVIRGDARLWAIPYRFGKRGAMPYRFGRRAAMPMRFGKKSFFI